jgi:CTP:molybdopterin cytidylyltransferase MocA
VIDRRLWPELLALPPGAAPRDVINRHGERTQYVSVDDDSILRDVDTPEAYRSERRRAGFG